MSPRFIEVASSLGHGHDGMEHTDKTGLKGVELMPPGKLDSWLHYLRQSQTAQPFMDVEQSLQSTGYRNRTHTDVKILP